MQIRTIASPVRGRDWAIIKWGIGVISTMNVYPLYRVSLMISLVKDIGEDILARVQMSHVTSTKDHQ
jgi:hypothetical protein